MLGWRLGISAILIPALIGIFRLDHLAGENAPWLFGFVMLLVWRATWEFAVLLKVRSFEPSYLLIATGSTVVVAAAWSGRIFSPTGDGLTPAMHAFSICLLIVFLRSAIRYREPGKSMETVGCELLGIAYIGCLLAVTAQLRWIAGAQAGYLVLASLVIAAKSGDVGGYTLGRLFGKRKMVPTLSPGKTWMGALGAVLGASLASVAWLHFSPAWFFNDVAPCPIGWSLLYGAVIGVVGLIGDLAESLIKRDVEKKDAANLMPGFGGLLDLLDSVLYAGPIALVLWQILPLVTW